MPILRIRNGPRKGAVHDLEEESVVLGRDEKGTLQIPDQGVSRRHAEIFRIGEMYFVKDLGSRNGTFVNDQKTDEAVLRLGDQLRIGSTVVVFEDRVAPLHRSRIIKFHDSQVGPGATIHIRLKDTKPAAPGKVEPEAKTLEILRQVSMICARERNLPDIMNHVVQLTGQAMRADHAFIFTIDRSDESNPYPLAASFDTEGDGEVNVSRAILHQASDEGHPVLCSDASLDDRFRTQDSVIAQQIRSVICVPLKVMDTPVGLLYVSNARIAEAFTAEDLELAANIGLQLGVVLEAFKALEAQNEIFRSAVLALVAAVETRRPESRGRAKRVATYAQAIARSMGLSAGEVRNVWIAAMLHDIGTVPLSDRDLKNPALAENRKIAAARELLEPIPGMKDVFPGIAGQKERHDGSGSPEGKRGDEIPLLGRIVGLSLELDHLLTTKGPEGQDPDTKEALNRIRGQAGRQFHPDVVRGLLVAYRNKILFRELAPVLSELVT